nr:carbon-nitrogen hydrolase family protein [uncultured Blautia sp.]
MKLALIQLHSKPTEVKENVEKGIKMYQEAVQGGAELVVFPELWTCGYYLETFDFEAAVAENDWILEKFRSLAKENGTVIVLPLPQKKEEKLYIGLYVIEKDGMIIKEYQKSFLWGREQNYFVHGKREYEPVDTSVGRLGLLICYDIEFPEPSRALVLKDAQIILVPSVWSIPALNRWQIQLPARALDNTVFVAGINNVGEGACGHSKVVNPDGAVLIEASADREEVVLCDVDYEKISEVRSRIPYLEEYDPKLAPQA